MFRDYIYLDTKRVNSYGRKLGIGDISIENGDSTGEEMYFEKFEYELEHKHINKDFLVVQSDNEADINKVNPQMIIKLQEKLLIPNEFGEVEFLKRLLTNENMKNQLSNVLSKNDEEMPKEFFATLIKDRKNFPIYCEVGQYIIHTSLNGEFFRNIEYFDFEENIGEVVTIVAKVDNAGKVEKDIVLYDIYKDLFGMNRQMRRAFNDNNKNIPEEIKIKGKGIKISILAIYK